MVKEHRNHLKQRREREASMTGGEMRTLFESVAAEEGLSREELSNYIFTIMCENSVKLIDCWDNVLKKIGDSELSDEAKDVVRGIILDELRAVFPDWG